MPQNDPFMGHQRGLTSPASQQTVITPQDGVDLPIRPRVLRVLHGGDLALRDETGAVVTYGVQSGETVMFSPIGVEATGTTAVVVGWL